MDEFSQQNEVDIGIVEVVARPLPVFSAAALRMAVFMVCSVLISKSVSPKYESANGGLAFSSSEPLNSETSGSGGPAEMRPHPAVSSPLAWLQSPLSGGEIEDGLLIEQRRIRAGRPPAGCTGEDAGVVADHDNAAGNEIVGNGQLKRRSMSALRP
jgi:hypothetical protein